MRGKIEAAKYNYSLGKSWVALFSALGFSDPWFLLFSAIVFSGHNPSPTTHSELLHGNVANHIGAAWAKWLASVVLCDKKISARMKGKFYQYRSIVRPAIMHDAKC
ncbi:unnamed protein product [Cuscuta campestris]|uniref:Uncharacterized protein n=1 Tax=Cuscuta campestris TaxID=132261 RepID=A0A484KNY7_9ASTE|nr:unnamed protein product [Cuscuta campestris]